MNITKSSLESQMTEKKLFFTVWKTHPAHMLP